MKNTKRLGIVIIIGLVLIALASAATWAASSAAASAKAFNAVDLPDGEYTPDNTERNEKLNAFLAEMNW